MPRQHRSWMQGKPPSFRTQSGAQYSTTGALRSVGNLPSTAPPGLEAGAITRRLVAWNPTAEHVNSLMRNAGPTVLSRARWLVRNNGYARSAFRSWRAAAVGDGIKPSPLLDDRALKEAIDAAWLAWTDEADAENLTDLYGIQRRVAGEAFLAGECFCRIRPRRPEDDLLVPLQLQILPAEQCPHSREETLPNGNVVRLGIEFDRNLRDKRVAYWFYRSNPTDGTMPWQDVFMPERMTRVPAEEVLHIFDPVESGQIRGLTSYGAAMVKMFHLDLYDDAELERKKQQARHAAFITMPLDDQNVTPASGGDVPPIAPYGPGAYVELAPGEDVKFTPASEVGSSYDPFQYRTLLAMSAALGIPYHELSADLQRTSYASSRAALIAFRQEVTAFQHATLAYQFMRPVWHAWLDAAVLAGAIPLGPAQYLGDIRLYRRVRMLPPKMAWVDPLKDMQADVLAVQQGFKPRDDVIESMGEDPEVVDQRIAQGLQRSAAMGFSLPLYTTGRGPAPSTQGDDIDDDETERRRRQREEQAA